MLTLGTGPYLVQIVLHDDREGSDAHMRRERRANSADGKRRLEDVSRYVVMASSNARLTRSRRVPNSN